MPRISQAVRKAQQTGYLVSKYPYDERIDGIYYAWCEETNLPFVRITTGKGDFAEVEIDMRTVTPPYTLSRFKTQREIFGKQVSDLIDKFSAKESGEKELREKTRSATPGAGDYFYSQRIRKGDVDFVAKEFLRLGQEWISAVGQS